jgi:uncharacterized protein involved in exopolysaccharide biosynthesis
MTDHQNPTQYEAIIDVKKIIRGLLHYKWLIVGASFLGALVAFLVSSNLISAKYEASSYVIFTEAFITAELDSSIQVSPSMPDTGALDELAEADDVIRKISEVLNLDLLSNENKVELVATLQGKSQLHLQVTATDPELAAQIANTWGAEMVLRLNELYGTGEQTVAGLEVEVQRAKEQWNQTQRVLEEYLPSSKVEVLGVQLTAAKNNLNAYLVKIKLNRLLISDAETLQEQLQVFNPGDILPTENVLYLIALKQRTAGGISGTQFQFQGVEILGQDYTVEEGRNSIKEFISAIEDQNISLTAELSTLEQSISNLSVELESETFKVEQLSQERDLTRNAYNALANQLEETRITQAQDEQFAQIGAQAVVPLKPSGPRKLINTGLAGVIGFMLSVCLVFVWDWWKEE